jgi:hypothetical protein
VRKITFMSVLVSALVIAVGPSVHARSAATPSEPARLRIANVTLGEGDDGVTKAVFLVTSSRPVRASVSFATLDGSAVAGLDYSASSGTLQFTKHRLTRRIAVEVLGDSIDELDERFTVKLSDADGAAIAHAKGRATITDDDEGGPSISIGDATAGEAQSGAAFTVALSLPLADPVTVAYATADGSAMAAADYLTTSGTLTFDPGETVKQIVVPMVADSVPEVDETYAVNLSSATGVSIADGVGIGTITDDDTPSITIGNATVTEGNASTVNAVFSVTLSIQSSQAITSNYATADGSATAPADYQATSGSLTFDPGETVQQIVIPVVGDSAPEINETYAVNLSNATGASIADGVALGTITDDDTPTITVANASVTEGNSGTVNALFSVTLSFQSSQAVSFDHATADGSATAPADYQATSGSLTFDPGETIQQIVVPIVGDTLIETTEVFSLNLSSPVNATFADPAAQGTITDNDTVTISIGAATVTEANLGTRDAVFTVTLSAVSGSTVTVDYATANGSAVAPGDYLATSGTLTFAPGEVSKQIVVQTVGDVLVEANETYSVNLSNPANATIAGSGYGLGTITNND